MNMAEARRTRKRSISSSGLIEAESSGASSVSMKDDSSMYDPVNFGGEKRQSSVKAESSGASSVSIKDDSSMYDPVNFGGEKRQSSGLIEHPSIVSIKDDSSMYDPVNFGGEKQSSGWIEADSSGPSSVSVTIKDDSSMYDPVNFRGEKTQRSPKITYRVRESALLCQVPKKSLLTAEPSRCSVSEEVLKDPDPCLKKKPREDPEHQRATEEDTGVSQLLKAKKNLKKATQRKCSLASEGNGDQQSSLNSAFTTLFITTAESKGSHEELLFRRMKRQRSSDRLIDLSDIFRSLPNQEKPCRTVLTIGVAGIGKSFSVQKYALDWAEEKANLDIDFIFILAFRELNLVKDNRSLNKLLAEFHPALRSLKNSGDYVKAKVVVILDGLDESRLQLDFQNKPVTSVSHVTSVGDLLANLIQGNLLPNANLWITTRSAAANQIPAECVDMLTEIRGFSDTQKEEYFRRRFSHDLDLADRIISHIHSSHSLDIMCQIPVFCWIAAVLFGEIFGGDEAGETPQTLTEMMAQFLFAQTKRRSRKYDKKPVENKERLLKKHKEFLVKLGKLAFIQLQENNLIFYGEDLEDIGIEIQEAAIFSGFCTSVLREEEVFTQKKVFFFVHLTIQEFFAALFVYDCLTNGNTKELGNFLDQKDGDPTLLDLLKMTVDKVLEKRNGHLDFFLRFLLGLMVEPNRRVLDGLLMPPDPSQDADKKILTHLKTIRRKAVSPDSCINLFQTMVEMRDHKVKDEIQEYLKSDCSKMELTPLHCSALAYMLQVSKSDIEVLDLKCYNTTEEGRRRLIPAVRSSRKAILADCKVTEEWVKHLAFGLKFPNLPLRHLDLSNNDLKDLGVELLCGGLSSQSCSLETLRLSGCQVTERGCGFLAMALQSNPNHLADLDLSYNHPGDSGEKLLSKLERDPRCKLSKLSFDHGGSQRMKPGFMKYACDLTLDTNTAHKNLHLSEGNRKVTWVKEEMKYPHHPDRFDRCPQVLCEQGLQERCYWEVEVSEPFTIGLTYRSIGRKGDASDCKLGDNDKSWCLIGSGGGYFVVHRGVSTGVASLRSSRVGVYLDWPAGTLSFYRVSSGSQTLLHTYNPAFSEPLYPAVELKHSHCSALFCQPG